MKITLNWLKKHMTFFDDNIINFHEKFESIILKAGMELNKFEILNPILNVKIAEVETLKNMKVKKCKVNLSKYLYSVFKKKEFTILCGASNVKAQMNTLLAPMNTKIFNGTVISKKVINNIESDGMFLSEEEYSGIRKNSREIMEISEKEREIYSFDDVIIDISVPTHRWDIKSVRGISRLLCDFHLGTLKNLILKSNYDYKFNINVQNHTNTIFSFCEIKQFKVKNEVLEIMKKIDKKSSDDLQTFNDFIRLDIGHPIQIYDSKILKEIRVDYASKKIALSDKSIFNCSKKNIVIKNSEEIISLGGISSLKGFESDTKNIVIECAFFSSKNVNSMLTDSAKLFNIGIDHNLPSMHYLLCFLEGSFSSIKTTAGKTENSVEIFLDHGKFTSITNLYISLEEIEKILKSFSFEVKIERKKTEKVLQDAFGITVTPPSWRKDIVTDRNLMEEIVNIFGLNIELNEKKVDISLSFLDTKDEIRKFLCFNGFTEMINFPFSSVKTNVSLSKTIRNGLFLRDTLCFSLLENAQKTLSTSFLKGCMLFEIGKVYFPEEKEVLGILISGSTSGNFMDKIRNFTLYDLQKVLENLTSFISIKFENNKTERLNFFQYYSTFKNGYIGKVKRQLSFLDNTFYAQVEIEKKTFFHEKKEKQFSKYISLKCEKKNLWRDIEKHITCTYKITDIFQKENIKKYGITLYTNNLMEIEKTLKNLKNWKANVLE